MIFSKIENWVFYIFLFAIPISFRHIFNYEPFGFIEWQAISLYATDILLGVLLVFWLKHYLEIRNWKLEIGKTDYLLLAFIIVAGISIKNASETGLAWFQWVKLVEGTALYFYIKNYAYKRFDLTAGFTALVAGGIFQSFVGIAQYTAQHSLGLWWLGESAFNSTMTGVAAFIANGEKVIRAYGTTPHPNVLAAYMFIAIGAFYNIAIYHKKKERWHLFHLIMLMAFFMTYSRVVIGLWGLTFLIRSFLIRFYPRFHHDFWNNREMALRGMKIFIGTIVMGLVFLVWQWPNVINRLSISANDEAVQLRMLYNRESLESGVNWFGVGMGNFVSWLMTQDLHISRDLYQPVHNIYLLIYSETGIIGALLFVAFLISLLRNYYRRTRFRKLYHFSFMLIVATLLGIGLFDHFLWTIQAGRLVFWLGLGLAAAAE